MVDFTLTDEQKNLRELAHDFAAKEIARRPGSTTRTALGHRTSSRRRGTSAS